MKFRKSCPKKNLSTKLEKCHGDVRRTKRVHVKHFFLSIIRLFTVETLLADSFFYPQRNSPLGIVLIVVVRQIIKLRSVHKI